MGKTILVVEDQADNRRIMRDLRVDAGYTVIEATSGDDGVAKAHFRSEAATLALDEEARANSLTLRGRIRQSSYPGGFYRYTVDVGEQQFMVDDPRRLDVGAAVGVCLPAAALHLYGQ